MSPARPLWLSVLATKPILYGLMPDLLSCSRPWRNRLRTMSLAVTQRAACCPVPGSTAACSGVQAGNRFSNPHSSSLLPTPLAHSELPLVWNTSTSRSYLARNAMPCAVAPEASELAPPNISPQEKFGLCGITSALQGPVQRVSTQRSRSSVNPSAALKVTSGTEASRNSTLRCSMPPSCSDGLYSKPIRVVNFPGR